MCPPFDNNKELGGPATRGNVNVFVLDANKVIIKLRTSLWAPFSNCTLVFMRNLREGWALIHLISIMEAILPSASEVSRGLRLLATLQMPRDLRTALFPPGEGRREHE